MTEQYTPDSCAIGDDTLMIDVFVLEISKKKFQKSRKKINPMKISQNKTG